MKISNTVSPFYQPCTSSTAQLFIPQIGRFEVALILFAKVGSLLGVVLFLAGASVAAYRYASRSTEQGQVVSAEQVLQVQATTAASEAKLRKAHLAIEHARYRMLNTYVFNSVFGRAPFAEGVTLQSITIKAVVATAAPKRAIAETEHVIPSGSDSKPEVREKPSATLMYRVGATWTLGSANLGEQTAQAAKAIFRATKPDFYIESLTPWVFSLRSSQSRNQMVLGEAAYQLDITGEIQAPDVLYMPRKGVKRDEVEAALGRFKRGEIYER